MQYEYFINLDERGDFQADVRTPKGITVFEFCNDQETGELPIVEDGYMKHGRDIDGLRDYLVELGVIQDSDSLVSVNQ